MENILNDPALKYNYLLGEEYLEGERQAEQKHELMNGKIVTMTGASLEHNTIVGNLLRDIGGFLKGKSCRIFPSDLRVHIESTNSFTYPDATIVCGKPELLDEHFDTLLNPSVIIEVTSPSTETYDRGNKFFTYQQLSSLQEYILIDSSTVHVHLITKREDGSWLFKVIETLSDSLTINTIQQELPLKDIYDGIQF